MKFNNVLKSLKTSLAIVLVVILASCAKQLPKPSKEVKSILVIPAEVVNKTQIDRKFDYVSVSYTHLTLPTICSV